MSAQAARFVGSIPENYDRGLGPHIFADFAADLADRTRLLNPGNVLELAAGTGIVTRALYDALGADCDIVATDLNAPMLEVARDKFKPGEAVRFEQADAMDLPCEDASFDAMVCQFGVMFFPDKHRSYREACRVLKPGGRYIFNTWDSWDTNPFAEIAHTVAATFFADDPPGFYRVPFHYHDAKEIRDDLALSGFDDIAIEHVPLRSQIASAELFANGLVFGNPLYEEVTERGGDPIALRSAITAAIEEQLGSDMPLQALVISATPA